MTTRLLVSVRDTHEARVAVDAGADWIDAKEPRQGALGAVDTIVLQEIVQTVAGCAPVSAALGELLEQGRSGARAIPPGVTLAKFGLAGCRGRSDWPAQLKRTVASLPRTTGGVAVIYADHASADAPSSDEVIRHGKLAGCRAALVDTHDKQAGGLLDLWTMEECQSAIEQIRAAGMMAVMAGSLTAVSIAQILPLGPDYVAVRGAACRGSRDGSLDGELVRELVAIVRSQQERPVAV